MMRLTNDCRHDFTALYGLGGACRVRVFEPATGEDLAGDGESAGPVVILTDDAGSIPSLRYNIEVIAAEVLLRFALPTGRTAFVEHHPEAWCERRGDVRPETFELVTFERSEPERREISPGYLLNALSRPHRHPLPLDVVAELVVSAFLAELRHAEGHGQFGGAR